MREGNPPFNEASRSGMQGEYQPDVSEMSRELLDDFYQTFGLSQGDTRTHEMIIDMLAEEHTIPHTQLAESLAVAEGGLAELRPPRQHQDVSPSELDSEGGFAGMWVSYAGRLTGGGPLYRGERLVVSTVGAIVNSDIKYVSSGRPGRDEGADSRASVIRDYIIGDGLRGSDALLRVRDTLRAAILYPEPDALGRPAPYASGLEELASEWESAHPNTSFFGVTDGNE